MKDVGLHGPDRPAQSAQYRGCEPFLQHFLARQAITQLELFVLIATNMS